MRIAVLQPSYLPWLGYFDQIAQVDHFIFFDDVQYDKDGWRNRNKIKTDRGSLWLTVPVLLKGRFGAKINQIEVPLNDPWRRKHLKSIQQWYRAAPYYDQYLPFFEEFYAKKWARLSELTIHGVTETARILGIKTELHISSQLGIGGSKVERLVNLCKHFGADEYLSGDAAKNYLDEQQFARTSIKVIYQQYKHPEYPQLHAPFLPFLSIPDLLFNCGPDSLGVLCNEPQREKSGS